MSAGVGEVEALLRERAAYLVHGRKDRAAQVDAELARLGYAAPAPETPAEGVEEAGGGSARGRSGRRGS